MHRHRNYPQTSSLGFEWKTDHGFTLVELLVATVLLGIAMTAIYSSYFSQQKAYVVQTQVAAMQQNLRAAMHMMSRDIRMAGYDKENAGTFGLVSAMPGFEASNATCDATNIAFTIDADEDRNQDSNDDEMVAYRLTGTDLEKFTTSGGGTWQTIAQNIDALDFVYMNSARAITSDLTAVQFIEVTVLAQTAQPDLDYTDTNVYRNQQSTDILGAGAPGDSRRRRLLTSFIKCRNLGI